MSQKTLNSLSSCGELRVITKMLWNNKVTHHRLHQCYEMTLQWCVCLFVHQHKPHLSHDTQSPDHFQCINIDDSSFAILVATFPSMPPDKLQITRGA